MKHKTTLVIAVLILLSMSVTACVNLAPQTQEAPADATAVAPADATPQVDPTKPPEGPASALAGTTWQWTGYAGKDGFTLTPDTPANYTLSFMDDGTVAVKADCNTGGGTYTEDGASLSIMVTRMTRAACPPESLSNDFVIGLNAAESYAMDGENLAITIEGAAGTMTFTPAAAEAPAGAETTTDTSGLTGVVWQWQGTMYADGSQQAVPDPTTYTLEFLADGTVAVLADCNRASGNYTVDSSALTIEILMMTKAACPPASLSDKFIQELNNAATFVMDGDNLVINQKMDGGDMRFAPAGEAAVPAETAAPAETTVPAETAAPSDTSGLTGGIWVWLETQYGDGSTQAVDDPTKYTVEFMADGTVAVGADCNRGSGTYTADGESLSINIMVMTMAACPEGSLSDKFVQELNSAATYVMQEDNLFINLKLDTGNMKFAATAQ